VRNVERKTKKMIFVARLLAGCRLAGAQGSGI
jgi:hypothetical protein